MKYLWTTIHVKDLEKSIDFYKEVVGLELEKRFPAGPGTEIAFMKSQGTDTRIELLCRDDFGGQKEGIDLSLGFETEDADARMKELAGKGYRTSDMISPDNKTKFFFVKDPDGIDIQFVEE